jgi:N-acetylglucosaminyldiphosphoundecaprenol N-acetyl-beta-D-mannosaminyltransferase
MRSDGHDMIDRGKRNVLGVLVDVIDYHGATQRVVDAARDRKPLALTALAVHGVMTGVQDKQHQARLNSFDVVTADGQPVRWALNLLHKADLPQRTYGPQLTIDIIEQMATEQLPIYLYGSTTPVLQAFEANLTARFPKLQIAGVEPSKFRENEPGEPEMIAARVKESGARLLVVGLGCPRQEIFVHAMRPHLDIPMIAVGAAFDYHAGLLRKPPAWMQRRGLEWLWRLGLEPKRLWRRYLLLNPAYLMRLAAQASRLWKATPAESNPEGAQRFAV